MTRINRFSKRLFAIFKIYNMIKKKSKICMFVSQKKMFQSLIFLRHYHVRFVLKNNCFRRDYNELSIWMYVFRIIQHCFNVKTKNRRRFDFDVFDDIFEFRYFESIYCMQQYLCIKTSCHMLVDSIDVWIDYFQLKYIQHHCFMINIRC